MTTPDRPTGADINLTTPALRQALQNAEYEAIRWKQENIGTEHLLLGLIALPPEDPATVILNRLGVTPVQIKNSIEFIIGTGKVYLRKENPRLTPRSKKVIELAQDEARKTNDPAVTTTHLLIGLMHEGEGIAAGVLESLGVDLNRLRAEIARIQTQPTPAGQKETPTPERTTAQVLIDLEKDLANPNLTHEDRKQLTAKVLQIVVDSLGPKKQP